MVNYSLDNFLRKCYTKLNHKIIIQTELAALRYNSYLKVNHANVKFLQVNTHKINILKIKPDEISSKELISKIKFNL